MRIGIALSVLAAAGLFAGAVLAADATKPGDAKAPAAAPAAPAAAKTASSTEAKDLKWAPLDPSNAKGPQMTVVYGDPKGTGPVQILLKIPGGFKSGVHSHSQDYYGVVVSGAPAHGDDEKSAKAHTVGSTWFEPGHHNHFDACTSKEDCLVVVSYPAAPAAPATAKK